MNNTQSPSQIVRAVLALIEAKRWNEVGELLDPLQLEVWREQNLPVVRSAEPRPLMSAEQYRRHDPDMPLEVAQWLADRDNRFARERGHHPFGAGLTSEELEALDAARLFGRMLEATDPRTVMRRQIGQSSAELASLIGEESFERREVVGEIIEGDTAYVTCVTRHDPGEEGQPSVVALQRIRGAWTLGPGSIPFHTGGVFHIEVSGDGTVPGPLSVQQTAWVERRFDHELSPGHFPAVLERFRGTPARVSQLSGLPVSLRTFKHDGKWSVQEHIGHLLDLEALGEQRLADFSARAPALVAADMSNRATAEADHNNADWWALIEQFVAARASLVRGLERLPADIIAHRALHPRLQRPMNVPEWVFFMCEHDDHHLANIHELSNRWWRERLPVQPA